MGKKNQRTRAYCAGDRSPRLFRWAVQPPAVLVKRLETHDVYQNQPWEWETLRKKRTDALRAAEAHYGKDWKRLYREGYRCHRVKLSGAILDGKTKPIVGSKAWLKARYD